MNTVSEFDALGFSSYLVKPQTFLLDLSKSTLLEVIDEMCRVKDVISPRTTKNHSCLKNQLRCIEKLAELFNHSNTAITRRYLGLRQQELREVYDSLQF